MCAVCAVWASVGGGVARGRGGQGQGLAGAGVGWRGWGAEACLLLVVVGLGVDGDVVGHEVDRVEADAELADEVDIRALREGLRRRR